MPGICLSGGEVGEDPWATAKRVDISDKWKEYDTMHGVVSYQPRSNNIDGKLTVYQHLFLFAELAGLPKESIPATVRILLKELKLDELSQVKAKTLS